MGSHTKFPIPLWSIPILLGLILRILFFVSVWNDPVFFHPVLEDKLHYERAVQITEGQFPEVSLPGGSFLYPYIAASIFNLAGKSPEGLFFLQLLLDLLNIFLLFRLLDGYAGSKGALLGASLYAIHPLAAVYIFRMTPLIPAITLFLLLVPRALPWGARKEKATGWRSDLVSGLLAGVGTLLIPFPFILLGLLSLVRRWRHEAQKSRAAGLSAVFVLGWVVVTAPALFHNASLKEGAFTFAWTDGYGYYQAFDPESIGSPWKVDPPAWKGPEYLRRDVGEEIGAIATMGDVERWHMTRGTQRLLESPLPTLVLFLRKALLSISKVEIPDPTPTAWALQNWAAPFSWGLWLWPFLLGLFCVEMVGRGFKENPAFAILLGVFALDHLLGPVSGASRAFALPWIAGFAGVGLISLIKGLRAGTFRPLIIPLLAGIVATLLAFVDPGGAAGVFNQKDECLRIQAEGEEAEGERLHAIQTLRLALKENPGNPEIHNDLGTYYARESFMEESVQSYQSALAIDSTHVDALVGISNVLRASGNAAEAKAYLERLVSRRPRSPVYRNELGTLYISLGLLPQARRQLEEAVRLSPDYAMALANLRVLSQMERQMEELMIPAEMSLSPGHRLYTLSREMTAAFAAGDAGALDSLAAVARSIEPGHVLPDIMQGIFLSRRGEAEAALPFLRRANALAPGRAHIVRELVTCLSRLNKNDEALGAIDAALEVAADEQNRYLILSLKEGLK